METIKNLKSASMVYFHLMGGQCIKGKIKTITNMAWGGHAAVFEVESDDGFTVFIPEEKICCYAVKKNTELEENFK